MTSCKHTESARPESCNVFKLRTSYLTLLNDTELRLPSCFINNWLHSWKLVRNRHAHEPSSPSSWSMVRLSTLTGLNSQSTIIYGLKNGLETIKCLVSSRRGSSDSGDSGAPNVATKRKTTSVDLKAFFAFLRLCQSVGLGSAIIQRSRFRKVKCKAANLHITKKRNKHLCARPSSFQCQWSMVHVELYTCKKKILNLLTQESWPYCLYILFAFQPEGSWPAHHANENVKSWCHFADSNRISNRVACKIDYKHVWFSLQNFGHEWFPQNNHQSCWRQHCDCSPLSCNKDHRL